MTSEQKEQELTAILQDWCQGDCVLGPQAFVFAFDPGFRVTDASKLIADATQSPYVEEEVDGLVVLSQTCDIVKSVALRPFVEVAPLVKKEDAELKQIAKGSRPQFATVPGVSGDQLVADLDRTMTIEKPILATWKRIRGCRDDHEKRLFSNALARKRVRAALPNDFVELIRPLQEICKKRHGKDSPIGRSLEAISEIRVQPHPSWNCSEPIKVKFLFLLPPEFDQTFRAEVDRELSQIMTAIPESEKYELDHSIGSYFELSAAEYIGSDRLDLDYLSQ